MALLLSLAQWLRLLKPRGGLMVLTEQEHSALTNGYTPGLKVLPEIWPWIGQLKQLKFIGKETKPNIYIDYLNLDSDFHSMLRELFNNYLGKDAKDTLAVALENTLVGNDVGHNTLKMSNITYNIQHFVNMLQHVIKILRSAKH